MDLQAGISEALNLRYLGNEFKVIIDRCEGGFWLGRTEFDSPDVDNDVLVDAREHYIKIGEFVAIKIHEAGDFDLYGTPVI